MSTSESVLSNSSDAHLGLKSIEDLRLTWSVEFSSSTVGVSHGHICCFYYLIFSVIRSLNTRPVQLIQEIQFDSPGGFRIYILMGDVKNESLRAETIVDVPDYPERVYAPI